MATTIEIRDADREAIEDLKEHEKEPVKDVIARLIVQAQGTDTTEPESADAAGDLATLREQLDRIEDSATTAESRTGAIESMLEGELR